MRILKIAIALLLNKYALRLFWDIVVFRLITYLLNMMFKSTIVKQNFKYINFRINLTQFFLSITRDRNIR